MTTSNDLDPTILAPAQRELAHRLHSLGRRALLMDVDAILNMHKVLDTFRDVQRARLTTEQIAANE